MRLRALPLVAALLLAAASAGAQTLLSDPAMTPSSELATWEATFAQDENIDTDWSSSGDGTSAYADFDFGSVVRITQVEYTDRRNSGGANGAPAEQGCTDDVTSYDLIFSVDSTFGNGDDVTQSVVSNTCPTFLDTVVINGGDGYLARYVRFDVTGAAGPNTGAAEFEFYTDDADLSVVKSGPANATVGDDITYTITVTNNGPAAASDVQVTDTIPPGTTFVSATPSQGSCLAGPPVTCDLNEILSGGSATIDLTVTATSPGSIANTATVSNAGPEADPNGANNTSSAVATDVAPAGPAEPYVPVPTASTWALLALATALGLFALAKLR